MIELSNIWKRYSATEVLKGLNLKVEEGESSPSEASRGLER